MRVNLRGIHRIRKRLADGSVREYHYAWRGGPMFWRSDDTVKPGSPQYLAALADKTPRAEHARGKLRSVILAYLESSEFKRLAPRTQADIRTSIYHGTTGIDAKFGAAPVETFNDPRIRGQVLKWRDKIGGKTGDVRMRHLQAIVAWALDRGLLSFHHLQRVKSVYRSRRADMIWTDAEIDAFVAGAPAHVGRILIAGTETGLRPGNLVQLSRFHIETTATGRRIVITARKNARIISVPVTARMGALIDQTPKNETIILRGQRGRPYTHEDYLGDAVSDWRDRINAAAKKAGKPEPIRSSLRLYDARGTAATRLLQADASIREIATAMGWSIKRANEVIEHYVALHPDMADSLGAKIDRIVSGTKTVNRGVNQ